MSALAIAAAIHTAPMAADQASPSREVVVAVEAITKSFAARRALGDIVRAPFAGSRSAVLRGVSFNVERGELFGILGLNGAGKTTLLKILSTLLLPDSGGAIIDGCKLVADATRVRQRVAMVTADERSLNWRLDASENLRLFAGLHRLSRADARSRIDESLELVGLDQGGRKLVGAFSSGMRQRLLVARALLARPRILLLDEPTRSLDPVSAHDFRTLLRETLIARLGVTVVLATHNAEEAFSYCHRVLVLHRGSVAAEGSARQLAARFADDRYHVSTPTPAHPGFVAVASSGIARVIEVRRGAADRGVTLAIEGGADVAADVLRRLVLAGVSITRFEPIPIALSTLIANIVAAHDGSSMADADA